MRHLKIKKLLRAVFYGLFGFLLIAAIVVVTAGFMPPADPLTPAGFRQTQSVYVPMADGTKIAVRISLPPNLKKAEQIPAIIETTRYLTTQKSTFLLNVILNLHLGRKPPDEIKNALLDAGYAFILVEARGSGASFGHREMEWSKEEINDTGQVIEWVAQQPWSNGKIGAYGISYSGNTAELAAALNQSHLLCTAPLYSDFDPIAGGVMPGGILNSYLVENWAEGVAAMDANRVKGLLSGGIVPVDDDNGEQFLNQALQERDNVNVAPAFKKATYFDDRLSDRYALQSLAPFTYRAEIQKSGTPFYVRVGWLDAGTVQGAIERFLTYQNDQLLVIGPWNHGGSQFYDPLLETTHSREELEKGQAQDVVAFFETCLSGNKAGLPAKEIRYYTLGEGVWKTSKSWPVEGFAPTPFYFYPDGTLQEAKPVATTGSNRYPIDFSVTTGENNRWRTNLGGGPILYPDRAEADKKLLTYTSEPLPNDVEITGTPVVTLNLSSTASDGAVFVYLEDVSPAGKVTYITEGQLRALHRKISTADLGRVILGPPHSYQRQAGAELIPGTPVELNIGLFATSALIKKGHRLRIALAGQDSSCFERIPQGEAPTLELQTNGAIPSWVELPLKVR